jgi:carbamoyl-phosphate synthase large subunit
MLTMQKSTTCLARYVEDALGNKLHNQCLECSKRRYPRTPLSFSIKAPDFVDNCANRQPFNSNMSNMEKQLKLFIRQPFTGAGVIEQNVVMSVLTKLMNCDGHPYKLNFLTGEAAQSAATFKDTFKPAGSDFSATTFRAQRLSLIDRCDVFVNIRAAMSESTAFELAYHIYGRKESEPKPILFLHWKQAPFETTLLKELYTVAPTHYIEFSDASDLQGPLLDYFRNLGANANSRKLYGT